MPESRRDRIRLLKNYFSTKIHELYLRCCYVWGALSAKGKKPTCWIVAGRLYRQLSKEKMSNTWKMWILWRASICTTSQCQPAAWFTSPFHITHHLIWVSNLHAYQLTCSSTLLDSAWSIWSRRPADSPPVVSTYVTLCFRWCDMWTATPKHT